MFEVLPMYLCPILEIHKSKMAAGRQLELLKIPFWDW